jgi:acyl-CoA synthetase (AMP-forming)/AMP-acid ligase II
MQIYLPSQYSISQKQAPNDSDNQEMQGINVNELRPINPLYTDYLALHAKWRASKPAVIHGDTILSWRDYDNATSQVANGLLALGMQEGDRVIVNMSNSAAMVVLLFGIAKAGCCSVPLNLSVPGDALLGMAKDCGARALFASADQVARLDELRGRLPDEVQRNAYVVGPSQDGWQSYDDWLNEQSEARPAVTIAPETPMNIIYSSGTTGLPKGIIATQQGRVNWAYDLAVTFGFHADCRTLAALGLYSNISWANMLMTFLTGGTLIVTSNQFDAREALNIIESQRISHTSLVPVQFQRMLECEDQETFDLSSMKCAITVGSPMHPDLKRAVHARLDGALYEIYGLTEGLITAMMPDEMEGRWESVGRPLLGSDILILDDDDVPVSTGNSGEIVGAARFVMPRYHNRSEATEEATWTDDGGTTWLRTGDIGYIDDDGYLYVVDRKKDMILSGSQNIYPADIEAVLLTHEQVSEVAVLGVPSKRWGETPLALIVPVAGMALDTDGIKKWLNDRVGKQQRVVAVELIDELPRNPNGKVLKRELRERYKSQCFD